MHNAERKNLPNLWIASLLIKNIYTYIMYTLIHNRRNKNMYFKVKTWFIVWCIEWFGLVSASESLVWTKICIKVLKMFLDILFNYILVHFEKLTCKMLVIKYCCYRKFKFCHKVYYVVTYLAFEMAFFYVKYTH